MKMQNVSLDDIAPNPWRDMKLYPIDKDHVAELRESIDDHGFFGAVKGRRRNGKIEIGCGHMRIEAARKAKLDTVPIFIDDMDDDAMLRLMTDENATQGGASPGAVLNEVAAVTRRLIEGLLQTSTIVEVSVKQAFENKNAIDLAVAKLRKGTDVRLAIGENVIARYLGQGNPERSHRGARQIREAINALKQSGRYDDIVEELVLKYPEPVTDKPPSKSKTIVKSQSKPRQRILDESCANVFHNEHQFHAFREAITTPAAQKVIPVTQQKALAKEITSVKNSQFDRTRIGAPYIRRMVQDKVQQGLKTQRDIDKEEREQHLREERETRIGNEVKDAERQLRALVGCIGRLNDLAEQFPAHPKIGGFAARLDMLVDAIKQFSKRIK